MPTIEHLLTQTVTVRPWAEGAEDRYGDAADGWGEGVDYPARLEQVDGSEVTEGREALVSDWRLFLPADAVIDGRSRVVDDHEPPRTFEVVGSPSVERTPRRVSHVVARLRYVEG